MNIRVGQCFALMLWSFSAIAADPPPLRFAVAPAAAEVKITLKETNFVHELVVENASGTPAKGVIIETTTFSPGNIVINCLLEDGQACAPFDVAAFRSRRIRLGARIPKPGTYIAVVSVAGKTSRQSTTLSVTRPEPPEERFPVKYISGAKSAQQQAGALTIDIEVQDTSGKGATLNRPIVVMTRKAPGAVGQLSTTVATKFRNDGGDGKDIGTSWRVPKNGTAKLHVDVTKLDAPGEYSGFMRLTSPDVKPSLDVPLRIWIKRGGGLAALLITVGVLLSFGVRVLAGSVRPALVQYRNAARLAGDIRLLRADMKKKFGELDTREKALLDDYETRLMKLAELFQTGESTTAEADLKEIDRKLSMTIRWVNVRRRLNLLPAAKRVELTPKLDTVTAFLENRSLDRVDAAQTALNELDEAIEKAAKEESKENAAFRKQIDDAKATPVGFDEPSWKKLRDTTLAAIDAAASETDDRKRQQMYDAAFKSYTTELVAKLRDYAKSRLARIDADVNIAAEKKTDLKERVQAILASLDAAEKDAAAGNVRDAAVAATTAAGALQKAMKEVPGLLSSAEQATAAAPAPIEAGFGAAVLGIDPRKLLLDDNASATITRYLATTDLIVGLVALIAAVGLGLLLLWEPDVDWGSAKDMIAAVLWGLGLHQVGNAAFGGLASIAGKMK